MSNLIPAIDVSSSALSAERTRLDVIAGNIANSQTTHDANGEVYRRKQVVFESMVNQAAAAMGTTGGSAVRVSKIIDDPSPLVKVHMPGHPDADKDGMVTMPNVNTLDEMVDLMGANRSYEANLQVMTTAKQMFNSSMAIGQG